MAECECASKCRILRPDVRMVASMAGMVTPGSATEQVKGTLVAARNERRVAIGFWVNGAATIRLSTQETFDRSSSGQLETDQAVDRVLFWIEGGPNDYIPGEFYACAEAVAPVTTALLGIIELIDVTP